MEGWPASKWIGGTALIRAARQRLAKMAGRRVWVASRHERMHREKACVAEEDGQMHAHFKPCCLVEEAQARSHRWTCRILSGW